MRKLLLCLLAGISLGVYAQREQDTPPRKTIELPGGRAADVPSGPYKASWESLKEHYKTPEWFTQGKFGIFMHWGLYSVPAHASEWYARHMYSNTDVVKWHMEHFGRQDEFGYKDFIPMFTCEKFDPQAWAELFKEAGATYVIPTAEHHDGFALYDSEFTHWDAVDMGPHRDLIGDLGKAVREAGMKFGISNHRIENWDFMYPLVAQKHDLFDPENADFYGPPQKPDPSKTSAMGPTQEEVMDGTEAPQSQAFLEEWLARCQEIVDKYEPDCFWFDNGINSRSLDSIKLRFAAYYYNRAAHWNKDVSIMSKGEAYLYGTIKDYERQHRAPKQITDYAWEVDDPIGHKFGYVEGLQLQKGSNVIRNLVENISKNGNLTLNISPKADGTIPEDQQAVLREVGRWMKVNGEGVYNTRAWKMYGEGPSITKDQAEDEFRFTCKGEKAVYAFAMTWRGGKMLVKSLARKEAGKVKGVELLGYDQKIDFVQDEKGLSIFVPKEKPVENIAVFKIKL